MTPEPERSRQVLPGVTGPEEKAVADGAYLTADEVAGPTSADAYRLMLRDTQMHHRRARESGFEVPDVMHEELWDRFNLAVAEVERLTKAYADLREAAAGYLTGDRRSGGEPAQRLRGLLWPGHPRSIAPDATGPHDGRGSRD